MSQHKFSQLEKSVKIKMRVERNLSGIFSPDMNFVSIKLLTFNLICGKYFLILQNEMIINSVPRILINFLEKYPFQTGIDFKFKL